MSGNMPKSEDSLNDKKLHHEQMELGIINLAFSDDDVNQEKETEVNSDMEVEYTQNLDDYVTVVKDIKTNPPISDLEETPTHSTITQPVESFQKVTDNSVSSAPPHPSPVVQNCSPELTLDPKETSGEERDQWDSQIEFLLSCISMSVGLGNVWRFPFTAYENGGGAFLIPYLIVLLVLGRPMYYLEMCLGQFSSRGPVKVWEIVPFFKGVGYASMIGACCTASFYCSIMAVTVYYFYLSWSKTLPWSEEVCEREASISDQVDIEGDVCMAFGTSNRSFSELYYFTSVFPQLENINEGLGQPHMKLLICLFVSWIFIFLFLVKGIKSAGKGVYFTSLFPYVVLIALLIRGVTLPGSIDGMYYFIKPDWKRLLDGKVWFAAVSQCFFSLNVGFGTITFLASHNNFRHNVFRDAILISVTDTLTSLLAGCAIFSMLGYLAHTIQVPISEVTRGGPALAFIAFPESIARLKYFPQAFAVLFFLMLFSLGVGSAVALAGQAITIILDQFPKLEKWRVALFVSVLGFISGIIYITPGGQFILTLVNHNGADFIIYVTAMFEIIAVSWVYGVNRFSNDIKFMLGRETSIYWKICWAVIMPVGLFGLLIYFFVCYTGLTHEGVEFPTKAIACGWLLSSAILSVLPICALDAIRKSPGDTILEKLKASLRPLPSWGPKLQEERNAWLQLLETKGHDSRKDSFSNASTAPQTSISSTNLTTTGGRIDLTLETTQ